jgi:hypothetical protein
LTFRRRSASLTRVILARPKLTYSNVVSTLCLFILLGGGAYAAAKLPKNSVGTKQLKKNAVKGPKVKNRSLTKVDIRGPVDSATSAAEAAHAAQADRATTADKLGGLNPSAFQPQKVRVEIHDFGPGDEIDFTPDVTGLSVLVFDLGVPTLFSPEKPGNPSLPGGVDGQRLTIVSLDKNAIFSNQPDLVLGGGGSWSGVSNDTLTLVFADGVWYETGRSVN